MSPEQETDNELLTAHGALMLELWRRLVCRVRGHHWGYVRTTLEGKVFRCRRCGLKFQPPHAVWRD